LDSKGNPIYLAQQELQTIYPIEEMAKNKMSEIDAILNEHTTTMNYKIMARIASQLYENACSAMDLMEWMKSKSKWNDLEKANIGMYFMKVKSEFRCEKLLILYLLDIMYFYPTKSIRELFSQ